MAKDKDKNFTPDCKFAKGNDIGKQFKPGQSGNPSGPPKAKSLLWRYICKYLDMTDAKLEKAKAKSLTQAQQAAIKIVEDFKAGNGSGATKLAKYAIDRDLGKAVETVRVSGADPLTDDECEDIREILKNNAI